jgi:hypothetical protein
MTKTIRPLKEYLAEIPDPRDPRGRRHPLVAILCLCCLSWPGCGTDVGCQKP